MLSFQNLVCDLIHGQHILIRTSQTSGARSHVWWWLPDRAAQAWGVSGEQKASPRFLRRRSG